MDNFEVDFLDKTKSVVVEIDGPCHVGPRLVKDRLRDDVLKYIYKRRTHKDLDIHRVDARNYNDLWLPNLKSIAADLYQSSV